MTLVSPSSAQWSEQKLSAAGLAPARVYPILVVGAQNLFTFSEQFDNAAWLKAGTTSVAANAVADPNAGTTADNVTFVGGGDSIHQSVAGLAGQQCTFSVYLQNGGARDIYFYDNVTGFQYGLITPTASWVRYTLSKTFGAGATDMRVGFGFVSAGVAGTVSAWGAQLNRGAVARTYQPTTTATVDGDQYAFTTSPTGLAFTPNSDGTLSINAAPGADAIQLIELGAGPILFPN